MKGRSASRASKKKRGPRTFLGLTCLHEREHIGEHAGNVINRCKKCGRVWWWNATTGRETGSTRVRLTKGGAR